MDKTYGNNIRLLRQTKNMSLQEMADALNISYSKLRRAENNLTFLRIDDALDMAEFLGIPVNELFYKGDNVLLNRLIGNQESNQ